MEQQKVQNTEEVEINLLEVIHVLLNKLWIIILCGLLVGAASVAVTIFFITPQYESTTKMYVLSTQDSNTLTNADMQTSLSLTQDYAELVQSRTVMEGVISQLNLDLTYEQLLSKITVESVTDTRILSISVRDANPTEACEIANAVRDTAANHIQNVMDIDAVNVVDEANVPDHKVSPSVTKNGIIGILAGGMAAAAVILISYLINDTVKTQEDVERYLGLSVLGSIPVSEGEPKKKSKKKKKNSKGGRQR